MSIINAKPVTPKDCLAAMRPLAKLAKYPVMLHGAPGIGKTSIVEQLAAELGGPLLDVRLTTIESVDLRGLPYLNHETKESCWYKPEFLPSKPGPGILFFDEITAAERRLQASAYSILQERRIGNYRVPDGWFIVAAGNGAEHGAIANEMGTALADRLVHFNVVADAKAWIDWGKTAGIAPEVLTFIQVRPDYLERCETRVRDGKMIDASPRGWHRVSTVFQDLGSQGSPRDVLENVVQGIVGEVTAAEFFAVLDQLKELVDVNKLIEAKPRERAKMMPKTMTGLWGLTYSLIAVIKDVKTVQAAIEVVTSIKDLQNADEGVQLAEITTLGMEMLMEHAMAKGFTDTFLDSKAYQAYHAERKKQGLVSGL